MSDIQYINRYWKENNGKYELHFEGFYEDRVVLEFQIAEDDSTRFDYVSDDDAEGSFIICDSIEDAKAEFEEMYEEYLKDQIKYYQDYLALWTEAILSSDGN